MTKRDFLTAIANGTINAEITEYASAELVKMDEANEKRKNKPSKKAEENAPILASILEALTETPTITADIATAVGVSTPKASALLRQLVAEGKAVLTFSKNDYKTHYYVAAYNVTDNLVSAICEKSLVVELPFPTEE